MIQLRNVPDTLHRKLKARAAMQGMSLSDYLLSVVREHVAQPTMEEMLDRLSKLPPVDLPISPEQAVREERDRH